MNTKDLNYAAFLIASKKELNGCYPEGRRFWFVFNDDEDFNTLMENYYMNVGLVKPQDFVNAQKTLKNLIRNFQPV